MPATDLSPAPAAPREAPPAVEARALVKRYGALPALDGVDLSLLPGETLLLLGPNGAGKSTLLRVLATLTRPTSGTLRLHGRDAAGGDLSALRSRIGLLTHQTFLYDHLTAMENLVFYARLYGLVRPRAAAREALGAAGLGHRIDDLVRTLSRGMQQRVAIARATLHAPDLLLLDEPFTGLDPDAAEGLQRALRSAREKGRTCVLTSHDFAAGLVHASRVMVLAGGRVALDRETSGLDAGRLGSLFREVTRPGARATGAG